MPNALVLFIRLKFSVVVCRNEFLIDYRLIDCRILKPIGKNFCESSVGALLNVQIDTLLEEIKTHQLLNLLI